MMTFQIKLWLFCRYRYHKAIN